MKRFLALFLSLALLLTLVPAAFAEPAALGKYLDAADIDLSKVGSWQGDKVAFSQEDGKGYNGGTALKYTQTSLDWGTNCMIKLNELGANMDWSGAEVLWFWLDASEWNSSEGFEVCLAGANYSSVNNAPGSACYLWDGEGAAETAETYDGWGGHGRVRLPANYTGFVGVALNAYTANGLDLSTVTTIIMKYEVSAGSEVSVYLDEFWLTSAGSTPDVEPPAAGYVRRLTDMENLEDNPTSPIWFSWQGDLISVTGENGKGFDGSRALNYTVNTRDGSWGGEFVMMNTYWMTYNAAADAGIRDWTQADTVWFWIDTTGFASALPIDVYIQSETGNGNLIAEKELLLWNGGSQTQTVKSVNRWDGVGTTTLPQGYVGFVGIPFENVGIFENYALSSTQVDYANAYGVGVCARGSETGTAYIDEIWLTSGDARPGVTYEPYAVQIEDMNGLPDPLTSTYFGSWCPDDMALAPAADKGVHGSAALAYTVTNFGAWGPNAFLKTSGFGFETNWLPASVFWFWVDMSGVSEAEQLELRFKNEGQNDVSVKIGVSYYLWDGMGDTVETRQTQDNYNGERGRFHMPQGYVGYVGLPLSAIQDGLLFTEVTRVSFQLYGHEDGATVYLDNFWLTDAESKPDPVIPKVVAHSLLLEGNIGVVFYMNLYDTDAAATAVSFTWGSKQKTVSLADCTAIASGTYAGCYKLSVPVSAKEIADPVTATIRVGGVDCLTDSFSAADYAETILADETHEIYGQPLYDLAKAMLLYGAQAQREFGYNLNALADASLNGAAIEPLTENEIAALGLNSVPDLSDCGLRFHSTSLILRSETTLRLYFQVIDETAFGALIVKRGEETLTAGEKNGLVFFDIANIHAKNITDDVTLTFNGAAATFNAGAYIRSALRNGNETLCGTVSALYRYNQAAKAFFN